MAGPARASKPSRHVLASRVPSCTNVCDGDLAAGYARAYMKCGSFGRREQRRHSSVMTLSFRDKYVGAVSLSGSDA
jgi:hypothetical protein